MEIFEDIDDVRDWLEAMEYETFWREIEPYQIETQPRWHCDVLIAGGEASEDLILDCLKFAARIELTEMLGLPPRIPVNDPDLLPMRQPRPASDAAFLQAILEGIADIEARCFAEIKARGGSSPTQVFTAGGGAKNETWTEIRARHLGQRLVVPTYSEAAIGVARLAQVQLLKTESA